MGKCHIPPPLGPIRIPYPKVLNSWFHASSNHYFVQYTHPSPKEFSVGVPLDSRHFIPTFLKGAWGQEMVRPLFGSQITNLLFFSILSRKSLLGLDSLGFVWAEWDEL